MSTGVVDRTISPLLARLRRRVTGGPTGNVFKGMAMLLAGNTLGRAVALLAVPVLARIYSPADFGVAAVFSAFVGLLAPIVSLCYPLALPLPRHNGTAMNLLVLSLGLNVLVSLIIGVVLFLFGAGLFDLFDMSVLVPWWWLLVVGIVLAATYETFSLWASRARNYKVVAITNVWQNFSGVMVKLSLGLLGFKPFGLLLGQIVSQAGGNGMLIRAGLPVWRSNLRHVSLSRMGRVAWRWRGFPAWRMATTLALKSSIFLPVFFMAYAYSGSVVGQFSMAMAATKLPINLIVNALSKATFAEFAALRAQRKEADYMPFVRKLVSIFLVVGIPITAIGYLFLDDIFVVVLGDAWHTAGLFASILILPAFAQAISNPVTILNSVIERHRLLLWMSIQRLVLLALVFWACRMLEADAITTVWSFSIMLSIHYIISMTTTVHGIRKRYSPADA